MSAARGVRASEAQVEAARWEVHVSGPDDVLDTSEDGSPLTRRDAVDLALAINRATYRFGTKDLDSDMYPLAWASPRAAGDADEVTRLRGELKRLGLEVAKVARERSAAEAERDEIAGRLSALLCELTGGRMSKTTYDVRTMVQEIDSVYDDAHREDRAERDRLAEVVARVEALADERDVLYPPRFGRTPSENYVMGYRVARADLRAALSGPSPAETPQNGPEPALSREQGTSGQSGEGEALRGAERCHGDRDGDCSWSGCPQLRDGEPVATGRHCPLDTREEGR